MTRFRMTILALIFLSGALSLQAQENEQAALVRSLNNSVLQLHAQLQAAGPGTAAGLRAQGETLLAQRAAALSTLIEEDPTQALELAFDDNVVATLSAAFPQSASSLESHGVFEGTVEYVILDDHTLAHHRVDIRMDVAGQNYFIHFPEHEPDWLKCGDILKVDGVKVGAQVAAASGSVTGSVAGAGCTTTGQQKIVAILIQFPGYPLQSSVTPAKVSSILFDSSTSVRSVNTFWQEASHGAASATGIAVGPYTLSQVYSCDDYYNMRSAAIAAADNDVNFTQYTRVMIVFPSPGSCSWAGLGTLGCSTLSSADGNFTASTAWLLSNYMGDNNNGTKLSTHEGGHNLTLHHASSRAFTNATTGQPEALGPLGTAGTLSEYGDLFNTMGSWNFGQYNAPHKVMIGWLTGSDYQTVQSNGTFSLVPFELNTGLRALKVQRGTSNNAWLWLEYRQPLGNYDSALPYSQVYGGALVHYQDSTTGTHTHLIDMTPGSSGGFHDPAKLAGTGTFVDPYTNLSFSVDSATSSAMGVSVFYGSVPCTAANPTVSLSPGNPSGEAGSPINFTMTVTNNDSSGCSASDFQLSSSLPGGWTTSLAASLNIAPGDSASTGLSKTAPAGTSEGTYQVAATAMRGSDSGTGYANATIVSPPPPPTLSLQVPAGTVPKRSTATFTATVMSGSSGANGAVVSFSISNGSSSYSGSATAGSDGQAQWSYHFKPKDPEGEWTATAVATWNSMTTDPASDTFDYVTVPVPCTHANPTLVISPSNMTAPAGSEVDYTVTVTNNDSSSCSPVSFGLTSSMPSGWATSFVPASLSLGPGQSATSTMTKSVPSTASGVNPVDATAASGNYSATDSATFTVGEVAPVTVSVTVDGSSFAPRSWVPISAQVNSNGPAEGASVEFTMLKSDGKTSTYTATADASGIATWNYKLHPKDPSGTYHVSATATYNGSSAQSAQDAMFTVQ